MKEVIPITPAEYKTIEDTYQTLLQKMDSSLTDEDRVNLDNAYQMALKSHAKQRRKSGEPYILHPLEVARICFDEIGLGPTAVVAAILHDVVEDTPVTQEDINEKFGEKIGLIVDGLTKLDGMYNKTDSPQAANFKKVLSTLVKDVRVSLIKMADRLHNLRTIGSMPQHKKLKIAAETSYIYAPLAHRLGLYQIKTEFQDICMSIQEPEAYQEIKTKLKDSEEERAKYIEEFIAPLKREIDKLGVKYRILGRVKSIYSIHNKIVHKKVSFEEIYDLFAIRIILDIPVEKEKTIPWQIYSIITSVHRPIPERLKDWITTPKSNGYESLHTSVIGPGGKYVEVQIRSERMDEIAERGFAAHWKYKGVGDDTNIYDNWLDNIRDLLDSDHSSAFEFINDFKSNLFQKEIYVFTPNGDMKILPKGATALDFAFDIHTDIGYHAKSIKVNNKLVHMGYELRNGDQITVNTDKNQKPKEEWLNMVQTGKARAKIRSAMKTEKRKLSAIGKESLERKLKNMKVNYTEANIDFLVKHFKLSSHVDLFYEIWKENIKLATFKQFNVENGDFVREKVEQVQEKIVDTNTSKREIGLFINGEPAKKYKYEMATCCSPVAGDNVFGYLNASQVTKIHRSNCPNAMHILANYGYRILRAEWSLKNSDAFETTITINGVDSGVGTIQYITKVLTDQGINIISFNINSNGYVFECKTSMIVSNKKELDSIVKSIKELNGITSVIRSNK